jgi:hypothetical protein
VGAGIHRDAIRTRLLLVGAPRGPLPAPGSSAGVHDLHGNAARRNRTCPHQRHTRVHVPTAAAERNPFPRPNWIIPDGCTSHGVTKRSTQLTQTCVKLRRHPHPHQHGAGLPEPKNVERAPRVAVTVLDRDDASTYYSVGCRRRVHPWRGAAPTLTPRSGSSAMAASAAVSDRAVCTVLRVSRWLE